MITELNFRGDSTYTLTRQSISSPHPFDVTLDAKQHLAIIEPLPGKAKTKKWWSDLLKKVPCLINFIRCGDATKLFINLGDVALKRTPLRVDSYLNLIVRGSAQIRFSPTASKLWYVRVVSQDEAQVTNLLAEQIEVVAKQ